MSDLSTIWVSGNVTLKMEKPISVAVGRQVRDFAVDFINNEGLGSEKIDELVSAIEGAFSYQHGPVIATAEIT